MGSFKSSLAFQMAVATFLGILTGVFLGDDAAIFGPWSSAYIMILKITAIPYLMVAIIHGVGQMNPSQGKEILKKGVLFIILTWMINITMIYLMAFLFPSHGGSKVAGYIPHTSSRVNFADLLIPENIFYSLSNNVVPAVVMFSLLIGLSLMFIKEKKTIMDSLETVISSLTRVTMWIGKITPIGTFLIMATQIGTIHFATIKQIGTYIILYITGISLIVFWIFPRLISMLTHLSAKQWLKNIFPILILGYTTNVVIVCIPYIIQLIQTEIHQLFPKDEKAVTPTQGIVAVMFNLPLGALFIAFFVLFVSVFYHTALSLSANIELLATTFLTGLGSVGLGSWINSLTFLLESLGLPLDALNLYLATIPFTAGFQSMVSVTEIAGLSLLITLACRDRLIIKWNKVLSRTVVIVAPIILLFICIKAFNPLPKITNTSKSIYELALRSDVKIVTYSSDRLQSTPRDNYSNNNSFENIIKTKKLRVGYYPDIPPLCFYNHQGDIVGYDMAIAAEIAFDLGCTLELVPLDYARLAEDLSHARFDIGMSGISITEERLKKLNFARSYVEGKIIFVVRSSERKALNHLPLSATTRIAILKGSAFEPLAKELFPQNPLVPLATYDAFTEEKADLLLWEEQEAIAWVILHPGFSIIIPESSLGIDSFGYAVNPESLRLLEYLNQWLQLKKKEGFIDTQHDLWVLRKTERANSEEPRWSILKNLLHW